MNKKQLEALVRADEIVGQIPQQFKDYANEYHDVSAVFEYLSSYFNTEYWKIGSSFEDWMVITFVICRIFDITINEGYEFGNKREPFFGAVIEVNDYYKDKVLTGINKIEYTNMYPAIIYDWLDRCKVKSDFFDFPRIFKIIFSTYKEIPNEERLPVMRGWINWCYGILTSYNLCDKTPINTIKQIQKDIYENFKGHIVYFDCDAIWFVNFNEIVGRFVNYNSELQKKYSYLTFTIQEIGHFYITAKKKYIEMSGEVKVRGLKLVNGSYQLPLNLE
jgi:hypothetical protein